MASPLATPLQVIALFAVVGIAAWLIHRAGAELRGQLKERKASGPTLTPEQVKAITSRGLATPAQLFAMSAKEQQMLAVTAMALITAEQPARRPARPS